MENTKVQDIMETNMKLINPDATLQEAAMKMRDFGCGFLPVGNGDAPEGIITDRDIVIRALAEGKDPTRQKVRDCMTDNVCSCKTTDTLVDAAKTMSDNNVSRLVVKDDNNVICGVLTFGRIIRSNDNKDETSEVVDKATGKSGK